MQGDVLMATRVRIIVYEGSDKWVRESDRADLPMPYHTAGGTIYSTEVRGDEFVPRNVLIQMAKAEGK